MQELLLYYAKNKLKKKSVLAWLLAIKKKYYLSQSHWNIFISTECSLSSEIPPQYCCEIGKMLGVHYHSYAEKLYSILCVVFIEFIYCGQF